MEETTKFSMDSGIPLREVVFHTLREAILKGELKPGERLMEIHLAEKLGVSRTPVREAIHKLEEEGLAVIIPRKGAEVAKMTEKDLEDVLQIRMALDTLAVDLAASHITGKEMAELKNALNEFEEATIRGDVKEIADKDIAFHDIIYRACGNNKLIIMINDVREQVYRYRYEYLKDSSVYPLLVKEHAEIIDSLTSDDRMYRREVMEMHILNQRRTVKQRIREQ
jgi:DNA-binding GntR family transcriptional regulator